MENQIVFIDKSINKKQQLPLSSAEPAVTKTLTATEYFKNSSNYNRVKLTAPDRRGAQPNELVW